MDNGITLDQAREAIKIGNPHAAQQILGDLVQADPDNAEAWEMLFSVLENPHEKLDCLNQVLRIHPEDRTTRIKMKKYKAGSEYRDYHTQYRSKVLEKEFRITWRDGIRGIFSSIIGVVKIVYHVIYDLSGGRWLH